MKKLFALCLALVLSLSLCGCKSKEVQECEALIAGIGTFVVSQGDSDAAFEEAKAANASTVKAIEDAQQAYAQLSDQDKTKVENYGDLEAANEALNGWKREGARRITLISRITLDAAVELTDDNVKLIDKTWTWFEREWDFPVFSCTWDDPWDDSWKTAHGLDLSWTIHVDGGDVIYAIESLDMTHGDMHNAEKVFEVVRYLQRDSFDAAESLVSDVAGYLKTMADECGEVGRDYYDALNSYYLAVESYQKLAVETGSVKSEFADSVQSCQDKIAQCQGELDRLCN